MLGLLGEEVEGLVRVSGFRPEVWRWMEMVQGILLSELNPHEMSKASQATRPVTPAMMREV